MEVCHRLSTCIATVDLMGAGLAPASCCVRELPPDLVKFCYIPSLEKVSDLTQLQPLFFEFTPLSTMITASVL